jgi:hypothetical protein
VFKRALLAFTFVAALGAAGLSADKAMAWSDCHRTGYPYPTYAGYADYYSFAPRAAYYPSYPVRSYPVFYGRANDRHHHHYNHHNHRSGGLTFSFGF